MPDITQPVAPLPKWIGVVGTVGVLAGTIQGAFQDPAIAAIVPPKAVGGIVGVCALLVLLSHSLTGTGGK